MRHLVVAFALLTTRLAFADRPTGLCVDVSAQFTPADQLQIVAWVEDSAGHFIETIYITSKVGRYGIGNRPGRFDFNSGSPMLDSWPYGRRITTFPVWAHRHGLTFPLVVSQDGDDNQLSHPFNQSSPEDTPPFCMPMLPSDPSFDATTCASVSFSDKGVFSPTLTSLYPPRADVTRQAATDTVSVEMYRALDVFDAISQATPPGGAPVVLHWAAPETVGLGDYVLWVEVARSGDTNATYNAMSFPAPTGIPYAAYGLPYRGQPSVVYAAPFTIDTAATHAVTAAYVGYGDPSGSDGAIRAPDATITTDTPGSGASRLELVSDGAGMYRLRVDVAAEIDALAPAQPAGLVASSIAATTATLAFTAPGDDGFAGTAAGYDVVMRASSEITDDNFTSSTPVTTSLAPIAGRGAQTFTLAGLLPETDYWIAVRAYDNCFNKGPIAVTHFTTPAAVGGTVDACFVATAAYGSALATNVQVLRQFRDGMLRSNVLGELGVEAYYTFGPSVAGVIAPSELLRMSARAVLEPIVRFTRRWYRSPTPL